MNLALNPNDATDTQQIALMKDVFARQQTAYDADRAPSFSRRYKSLTKLLKLLEKNETKLIEAMSADFGHRSSHESDLFDITASIGDIKETRRHLRGWMRSSRVTPRVHLLPGSARVQPQPLGVVGVISPWNFPVYLCLAPVAAALAAGNRVMIKPSEITPRTSQILAEAFADFFYEDEVCVITGGAEVGRAFSALPFDHILFTGSTAVGKHIARAAAENLTPVTLELGGKSPAIIGQSCDIEKAAQKIVYGKLANSGQICVSPDYVLVPKDKEEVFINAAKKVAAKHFPTIKNNPDYTSIVSDHHYHRLISLRDEAEGRGAEIIEINPANEDLTETRKVPLTLIRKTDDSMSVMQNEIFGPLLPVLTYAKLEEAIDYVNKGDRPLALYPFTSSNRELELILTQTVSGGVTVNDTIWHVACDTLPFGGVGASGMGAYHGKAGFDTFSQLKPIFSQRKLNAIPLFYPPYGNVIEFLIKFVRKIM